MSDAGSGGAGGRVGVPILALGYANADVIARAPCLPGDGDRVTATSIITYPGGMAANCACAAGLLGGDVEFLGNIGRGAFGAMLLEDFARYGVGVSHVARVERTTTAIVTVTPRGERAIISEPTVYHPEGVREGLEVRSGTPGFFYVDGYHLGWAQSEIAYARQLGYSVYCDLDGAPDTYGVGEVLEYLGVIDIVQWNPKVAAALFPDIDAFVAAQGLVEYVGTVITTRGGDSLHVVHEGRATEISIPDIGKAVDTTGAGDIFAGSFLAWRAADAPVSEAVRMAAEVASESTRYEGARMPHGIVGLAGPKQRP